MTSISARDILSAPDPHETHVLHLEMAVAVMDCLHMTAPKTFDQWYDADDWNGSVGLYQYVIEVTEEANKVALATPMEERDYLYDLSSALSDHIRCQKQEHQKEWIPVVWQSVLRGGDGQYEIGRCHSLGTNDEPEPWERCDDAECTSRHEWTVYEHLTAGGVQAVSDFEDEESANQHMRELQTLDGRQSAVAHHE